MCDVYGLVKALSCDAAVTTAPLFPGICPDSTHNPCIKGRSMKETEGSNITEDDLKSGKSKQRMKLYVNEEIEGYEIKTRGK
jgi:hypothetical protein